MKTVKGMVHELKTRRDWTGITEIEDKFDELLNAHDAEIKKLKENIVFRLRMIRAEYDDQGKVMASNAICKAIRIVKSGGDL